MIAIAGVRESYQKLSREEEIAAWASGDRDTLIRSQLPWVILIAGRVAAKRCFRDVDALVSAGNWALADCLKTYDARVSRLSTYCFRKVWWAMQSEIRRSIRGVSASVRVQESRGLQPTRFLGGKEPATVTESTAQAEAIRIEESGLCRQAVAKLPERERWVIEQRYFFHRTLEQIGTAMGITKERVRQLDMRAKRRMRESLQQLGVTE